MAKVKDNIVTEGLSGKLGKRLVFRRSKGGSTIASLSPVFSEGREFSDLQKAHFAEFQLATTYAKGVKNHPLYVNLAKGTEMNPYNVAVADWFNKPEVTNIDISEWDGQAGQTIFITANDDVKVLGVSVTIKESLNSEISLDNGQAVLSPLNKSVWHYTTNTAVAIRPGLCIEAVARDMPNNTGKGTLELN